LPPKRKYFYNNFRETYDFKRKQKAAVLDRGQANFRGPGGFKAKANDLTLEAKAKDFKS